MQSFIMNSHEVFIHIHQGCFAGTGAIVRLPQCQWSKPDGYGKISQCITKTKHSKAKTVCIFLGIYCTSIESIVWIRNYIHRKSCLVTPCLCFSVNLTADGVTTWVSNCIPSSPAFQKHSVLMLYSTQQMIIHKLNKLYPDLGICGDCCSQICQMT